MDDNKAKVSVAAWQVPLTLLAYFILIAVMVLSLYKQLQSERLKFMERSAPVHYPAHPGPVANLKDLKGAGRIYLIQVGERREPYSLDQFAAWLHEKYALDVQVLPDMQIDPSTWNPTRHQYIAESLYYEMKRAHPDLAANPNAYLVGFTEAEMYSIRRPWLSVFTQRDFQRAAIISTDGMDDNGSERKIESAQTAEEHFHARLRRILLKDVAILYWHLRSNEDPTSLLQNILDPDLPSEDIYESELNRAKSPEGESFGDADPCVVFRYSAEGGIETAPGEPIGFCGTGPDPQANPSQEIFEADLRSGLLIDRRNDIYLPDTIPIQFQRVLRCGWTKRQFGVSGIDSYDEFLGSHNDVDLFLVHPDGAQDHFLREPRWLPFFSLAKYENAQESGLSELRWRPGNPEHFELRRFDGEVSTYLTSYVVGKYCLLNGYRAPNGQELKFERDGDRRLIRLTSPGNNWLHLSYTPDGEIEEADDNLGHVVRYGYNASNQLVTVIHPSGETVRYEYDDAQHMLTFSVAASPDAPPRVLFRNEFQNGLLVSQTLSGGRVYTYRYDGTDPEHIYSVTASMPDGKTYKIDFSKESAIEWELSPKGDKANH